jgi:uncharacterized protein (TIGR02271 family)
MLRAALLSVKHGGLVQVHGVTNGMLFTRSPTQPLWRGIMSKDQHQPSQATPIQSQTTRSPEAGRYEPVPVVREQVHVGKRVRETGQVVVHIEPHVSREVVDVPLVEQDIDIQRVPVNRQVDKSSPPRQEGDTTIVPIYEEVLVVEKRLMLKEEIHITRRQRERHERQEVEVRAEQVHVLRTTDDPD